MRRLSPAHLYDREIDVEALKSRYACKFRTTHELALDLCRQFMSRFRVLGSLTRIVVVFDGAYAAKALVRPSFSSGR
ncbi:hypothetical protein [Planctomycetes bacterium Pan216]|uniref:hypothetical protein n=1 Tax=Kolteria novifilia TaxID=2527975 RepID=UPI0011A1DB3F